uniref:Uncharacterized protein n=1 Tax=Pfiesteria piscicida TaxID=71001 RepID=A3E3T3_PFIPI|nr:unknown [Pfiesteria piscicida]
MAVNDPAASSGEPSAKRSRLWNAALGALETAQKHLANTVSNEESVAARIKFAMEDLKKARETGDEAKVKEAKAEVEKAKAEVEKAKAEIKEAEAKVEKAEVKVKEAEAKVEKAKAEIKEAEAKVEKAEVLKCVVTGQLKPVDQCMLSDKLWGTHPAHFVNIKVVVDMCTGYVTKGMAHEDSGTTRVSPTCMVRCARGGKTTALLHLFLQLKSQNMNPIFITFNGFSKVSKHGSLLDRMCRSIIHSLMKDDDPLKGTDLSGVSCPVSLIVDHLKDQKAVLLIDELNQLINVDASPDDAQSRDVAAFLKEHFLSTVGRYFVFSSHIQTLSWKLSTYMESTSDRGTEIAQLSLARTIDELRDMGRECSAVTRGEAAFYGAIPALVFSVKALGFQATDRWQKTLQKADSPSCDAEHLRAFVQEVLTGKPHDKMKCFRELTDCIRGSDGEARVRWIPCFMARFLDWAGHRELALWPDAMPLCDHKDGKVWERVVAVAYGLRYLEALLPPTSSPHRFLSLGDSERAGCHVECVSVVDEATALDAAMKRMPSPSAYPCIQVCLPKHPSFEGIDLFSRYVHGPGSSAKVLMGVQMKEGREVSQGSPPDLPAAWWFRGNPPKSELTYPVGARGLGTQMWVAPSRADTLEFLGASLEPLCPVCWLPSSH